MKEHFDSYVELKKRISEIINYSDLEEENIILCLDKKWEYDYNGLYVNFDRYEDGDMEDYSPLQISSLGNKQEKLFQGVDDNYVYIMAYDENYSWDSSNIYVFKLENEL